MLMQNSGMASDSPSKIIETGKSKRIISIMIVVAVILVVGIAAIAVMSSGKPTTATVTNTSISAGADRIVTTATQTNPAGFVFEFSEPAGARNNLQLSDWAVLQQADGSEANVTVSVYQTSNASQTYFERFVAGVKGLSSYSDISSDLAAFQQYGKCYGYGEAVEGISVVNGVCTKGNVLLQVHLNSGISFSDLEADLESIMAALYQGAT